MYLSAPQSLTFLCTKYTCNALLYLIAPHYSLLHLVVPYQVPHSRALLQDASSFRSDPRYWHLLVNRHLLHIQVSLPFWPAPPRSFHQHPGVGLVFALNPPASPRTWRSSDKVGRPGSFFLLPVLSGTETDKQVKQSLLQPSW